MHLHQPDLSVDTLVQVRSAASVPPTCPGATGLTRWLNINASRAASATAQKQAATTVASCSDFPPLSRAMLVQARGKAEAAKTARCYDGARRQLATSGKRGGRLSTRRRAFDEEEELVVVEASNASAFIPVRVERVDDDGDDDRWKKGRREQHQW